MRLIGHLLTSALLGIIAALIIQHPIALVTCPPIGYASEFLWFPEERWWLKRIWRKLRGRCPMCGKPRMPKAKRNNPLDIYSYAPTCRSCAKILLGGSLYGAGKARLRQICEDYK